MLPGLRRLPPAAALVLGWLASLSVAACGGGGGAPPSASPSAGPTLGLPDPETWVVAWTTDAPVVGSVEYGTDASYGTVASEDGPRTRHEIALTGLPAGATIHYRLHSDGAPVGDGHAWRTAPAVPDAPVRIAALGDTGTGGPDEAAVLARVAAMDPDLVLVTGDLAYDSGTPWEVRAGWTVPFAPLLATRPVFAVLGNHDAKTQGGAAFLDQVVFPRNAVTGTEHWYAFDWGACHVVGLDSNQDLAEGSAQRAWLEADLAATNAPWRIVFLHHPIWSSSHHGSDPALQAALAPLFEAHAVDLVLCGHDHDYERTFPMAGATPVAAGQDPDYVDPQAPVYVVTGGGGKDLYPAGQSAFTAASESAFHAVSLEIVGDTLTLEAVRVDGSLLDRMTIQKTP